MIEFIEFTIENGRVPRNSIQSRLKSFVFMIMYNWFFSKSVKETKEEYVHSWVIKAWLSAWTNSSNPNGYTVHDAIEMIVILSNSQNIYIYIYLKVVEYSISNFGLYSC